MASQRDRWAAEIEALVQRDLVDTSTRLRALYDSTLTDLLTVLAGYVDRYGELSYSARLEVERLLLTAQQIAAELSPVYSSAALLIDRHAATAAQIGYAGVWYQLEQTAGLRVSWMGLDRRSVEAAVAAPVDGLRLSERLYRDRQVLAARAQQTIVRGIVEGRGYAETAARLADVSEAGYRQSLRIARTEAGRVRSQATQSAYAEAAGMGIQLDKRWVATLDSRTRRDHRIMDGQTVPWDGYFLTPGGAPGFGPRMFGIPAEDINCRCTTEAVVESYSSDIRRDNVTGETIPYTPFGEWYSDNRR